MNQQITKEEKIFLKRIIFSDLLFGLRFDMAFHWISNIEEKSARHEHQTLFCLPFEIKVVCFTLDNIDSK